MRRHGRLLSGGLLSGGLLSGGLRHERRGSRHERRPERRHELSLAAGEGNVAIDVAHAMCCGVYGLSLLDI